MKSRSLLKETKEKLNSNRVAKIEELADQCFSDADLTRGHISQSMAMEGAVCKAAGLAAYDTAVKDARSRCKAQARSSDEFYVFVERLRRQCQQIMEDCGLEAVLPHWPQRFVEEESRRSQEFQQNGMEAYDWIDALRGQLNVSALDADRPSEDYLFLGAASAVFFGGQYSTRCVAALVNKLIFDLQPLKAVNGRPYMELDFPVGVGQYNGDDNGESIERKRWFIDPVSLGLFHKYLGKRKFLEGGHKLSCADIFRRIRDVLCVGPQSGIQSLSRLIEGAIYLTDSELDLGLPEMLINVCREDVVTFSADAASLHRMLGIRLHLPKTDVVLPRDIKFFSRESLPKQMQEYPAIKEYYEDLSAHVRDFASSNKKQAFQNGLADILKKHAGLPDNLLVVAEWLSRRSGKIALSTLKNNFYELGSIWFPEMIALDFKTMSRADYMICYENMVNRIENDNTASQKITHVQGVHKVAVTCKMAPKGIELGILDSFRVGRKSRVRTQIVNHRELKAATLDLLKSKHLTRDQKLVCRVMILAFRTAMRRGELLKIRIKDIDPTGDWWVQIVSNQYGQNKSRSSTRELPLKLLLHPDEFADFKAFYHARVGEMEALGRGSKTSIKKARNGLLFGVGIHNMRLSDDYVTALAQMMLRGATGRQDLVLHSLRHSNANVMHAIIEQDYDTAELLSGLSPDQLRKIRREIVGPDHVHLSQYWEFAGYMGHSSAIVTFGSYLHLADLIVFNKILEADFPISKVALNWLARDEEGKSISVSRIDNANKLGLLKYMIRKNSHHYAVLENAPPAATAKAYEFPELSQELGKGNEIDPAEVWHRLKDYQTGKYDPHGKSPGVPVELSVEDVREIEVLAICDDYGLSEKVFGNQLARALALMHTPTAGNKKGVILDEASFYRARCEGHNDGVDFNRWCLPARPLRLDCRQEAHATLEKLVVESGKTVKVQQWAELVFQASHHEQAWLYLNDPGQARKITGWFSKIFGAKRWYLELYVNDLSSKSKLVKAWKKAMPKGAQLKVIKKANEDTGKGAGRLYYQIKDFFEALAVQNKGKSGSKKYRKIGSDQLKFISQILLIILGDD